MAMAPPIEVFFFFQAEDGIRYHCVTGVQTCALPIYGTSEAGGRLPVDPSRIVAGPVLRQHFEFGPEPGLPNPRTLVELHQLGPFVVPEAFGGRSEERRVGKECRSRWARYSEKRTEDA